MEAFLKDIWEFLKGAGALGMGIIVGYLLRQGDLIWKREHLAIIALKDAIIGLKDQRITQLEESARQAWVRADRGQNIAAAATDKSLEVVQTVVQQKTGG